MDHLTFPPSRAQVMHRPLTMPSPMRLPVEPALAKVAWTYLGPFVDPLWRGILTQQFMDGSSHY